MDIPILEIPIHEARAKAAEYRRLVKTEATEQDRALLRAYREMLKGERVIDLHSVMDNAGLDDKGRPNLAIARSDLPWVLAYRSGGTRFISGGRSVQNDRWLKRVVKSRQIDIPSNALGMTSSWCKAMVPSVPPDIRAKGKQLKGFYTLWEVEWEPTPPVDPLLLKCLGGPLYKIIGAWDLTETERAVLFDARLRQ